MSVSFFFNRRRLLALSLLTVVPGMLFAEDDDGATDAVAAAFSSAPLVVADGLSYDGGLRVVVRCGDAVAVSEKLTVTGADGESPGFTRHIEGRTMIRLNIRIRPKDTSFRVTAPGIDRTVETPPMFFCRPESVSPGSDAVFPVGLRFTQRLDPAQKPPKVTVTPAVPGMLAYVQGDRVVLTGAFPTRTGIRIRFDSDVLGADGWIFKAGGEVTVPVAGRSAQAGFAYESGVISPKGSLGVPLRICNLPEVNVRVARLSPENLVAALHETSVRNALMEETASKTVTLRSAPDEVREMLFDVRTSADKPGESVCGVRLLSVDWSRSAGDEWWNTSASSFINVTDLALTPMLDENGRGLTVWVTGISAGKPVSGAEVLVRSAQNRVLARGVSDESGLVRLAVPGDRTGTAAWVVTASKGDDFSYVKLNEARRGDSAGLAFANDRPSALLYAERGVHRGGETIRLTAVARMADGALLPATPMEFRLSRPDGRLFGSVKAKPESGGFYSAEFALPTDAPYGDYTATFSLPDSKDDMASLDVPVSAFEPLRLRTEMTAPETGVVVRSEGREFALQAGPSLSFFLKSKYRFGAPAAGLVSRAAIRVEPASVSFAGFPGFVFGYAAGDEGRLLRVDPSPLDASGNREIKVDAISIPGLWTVKGTANVIEPGGRTDTAFVRVVRMNAASVAGLAPAAGETPSIARPFTVRVALADKAGNPAPAGPVKLIAERVIENWTLQRDGSRTVWRRTTERIPAGEVSVPSDAFKAGVAEAALTLAAPGEHRLVATTAEGVRTEMSVWVSGSGVREPGAAPHLVGIRPPQDPASPGESVSVVVDAPFSGVALLTLETDRVLGSRLVTLKGGKESLDVAIPKEARGSVWLSLREIRPLEAKQPSWKPVEARGRAMLTVSHADRKLACAVSAPAKAAPGEKTRVTVRVSGNDGKPVAVHCWAVDTGVLDITGYATPDPFARFLGPKADSVMFATTFDELLPDFARTLERIGAGEGRSVFRGNGLKNRKPVALVWSGIAMTGPDGVLSREIVMPEHTGELRWMAVAAGEDRYGSGEAVSHLSRPVLLETSSPAFLAPGDTLRIPVALFNNTGIDATVRLAAETAGVSLAEKLPESVTLPAGGKPWRGVLTVRAGDLAGDASVVVRAEGAFPGGSVVERLPLNIRAAMPPRAEVRVMELKPGASASLAGLVPDFAPGMRCVVNVSDGSAVVAAPLFAALVDYPYGCLEQTSSRIIALATAGEAFGPPGAGGDEAAKGRVDALLRNGLARLALNMRAGGGLAYWPESAQADPEGSRLAAEAFIASAAHGVSAGKAFAGSLADYLRARLYATATGVDDQAKLCAALAGLGRVETNRMRYLSENTASLDSDGVASLALAWSRSGDKARAQAVLKSAEGRFSPDAAPSGGSRYDSPVVRDATMLSALDEASPGSLQAAIYAASLTARASRPLNTCEQGALLGALVKHAKVTGRSHGKSEVSFDDGLALRKTDGGLVRRDLDPATPRKLVNKGDGSAYVVVTTTGVPPGEKSVAVSSGITVRREYLDGVSGEKLDLSKPLRVGDSVLIRLFLDTGRSGAVPDIAVSDLFPACFEPEGAGVKYVSKSEYESSPVERSELREDRALAFLTAGPGMTLEYRVRVTAAGRFVLPPPQAMSMYRPDIRAVGEAGEITVAE